MIDRVTLKHGKTHCGRGLITDPTAHVVTEANADLEQNQPSGAESTEMHLLHRQSAGVECYYSDVYRLFFLHRYLIKTSDHNDKLFSTEATFGFC